MVLKNNLKEAGSPIQIVDRIQTRSHGGGAHIYLRMNVDLPRIERITLQACLGSDPVREMLSLLRHWNDGYMPVVLAETQEEAMKVRKWRKMV